MSGRRIAHGEARKLAGPFMDEADLVQEGYIGLLARGQAVRPRPRHSLLDLRAVVGSGADDSRYRPHRSPGSPARVRGRANPQSAQGDQALSKTWVPSTTSAILADEVGIDKKRAEFLLSQGQTVSLDQPVDDGPRARSLEHFLADESAADPDDEAIHAQEIQRMLEAFHNVLSERHRYVLSRRYGLEDNQFRTLSQVGKGMNLSRERVRQIEREALMRLREQANIRDAHTRPGEPCIRLMTTGRNRMTSTRPSTPPRSSLLDLAEEALDAGDPAPRDRAVRPGPSDAIPTTPVRSSSSADAYRELGFLEEAEQAYRRVTFVVPDHAPGWSGTRRHVLFDQLRFEESRRAALRALRLDPLNGEPSYIRGMLRERRG